MVSNYENYPNLLSKQLNAPTIAFIYVLFYVMFYFSALLSYIFTSLVNSTCCEVAKLLFPKDLEAKNDYCNVLIYFYWFFLPFNKSFILRSIASVTEFVYVFIIFLPMNNLSGKWLIDDDMHLIVHFYRISPFL